MLCVVYMQRPMVISHDGQIACVTAAGVEIEEPFHVSTYWGYEGFKHTEYHGQNK
jgi:hypothetical protein